MTCVSVFIISMNQSKELDLLHEEIKKCTKCSLHRTRTKAVPGEGPIDAKLMFVGEAPGVREDELGRPFVGRSGTFLTELLEGIGLSREQVFITSVLKSHPPKNRTPKKDEIVACMPFLLRQFDIIKPKIIVLLGGVAVSSIIGPWNLSEAHGRFYEGNGRTFFITYHPAAALRFPKTKEKILKDFQILQQELRL